MQVPSCDGESFVSSAYRDGDVFRGILYSVDDARKVGEFELADTYLLAYYSRSAGKTILLLEDMSISHVDVFDRRLRLKRVGTIPIDPMEMTEGRLEVCFSGDEIWLSVHDGEEQRFVMCSSSGDVQWSKTLVTSSEADDLDANYIVEAGGRSIRWAALSREKRIAILARGQRIQGFALSDGDLLWTQYPVEVVLDIAVVPQRPEFYTCSRYGKVIRRSVITGSIIEETSTLVNVKGAKFTGRLLPNPHLASALRLGGASVE